MGSSILGKAATLDALIKECIHAFDDNGVLQTNLPRMLLLMHRWYVSSSELAGKLLMMYRDCNNDDCHKTRLKICYLMRYWIGTFPAEFNLDLGLIRITEEFREVAERLSCEEHFKLIDISTIPSYDWMRKLTQRKKQAKKGKASLLFDHLEPMELAEHLTFLEFKSIRRISFPDYKSYVIHGCVVDNPTLERSIALFNGVSQWVQLMVLSKLTPPTRAEVITKYIHVAQKLLQLQNFNTLMAVVGGLSHSSISRLKETQSYLSAEVVKMWREMTELVSSNNNYSYYRKAFSDCQGFKIPILGVHLKDLIAMHVVFPDWVEDSNKVNLVKMQQLYMTFNELVSLQSTTAQVEPNMDLIDLLTLSLDLYYTEDEIYELSLLREPRNPKSLPTSPTTPNKPLVPLDWASGVMTKPDPTLVNKHIRKVVESVFRNYDPDHDGYISQEDFENIAANFPFLDSFCVLDKDQDGLISKDEMIAYFLRANPLLQCKMGPGFLHNFQEMTYLKPTFCEHCAGFLWGIIKQGYKCKDCGVNCHKQCRELLVFACRKLLRSGSLGCVTPDRLTHSSLPSSPTLNTCNDKDEVFEFPSVTAARPIRDTKSITLMTGSAQRISVRLQRATISQATQTEPLWSEHSWGTANSGSHTFPKTKYRTQRETCKNKAFTSWENEDKGPRQLVQCSGPSLEKTDVLGELVAITDRRITRRGKDS
ncbi:ras guanyl-releasing protein 3 [Hippocampus comes]|uniref:ras guanyl-releasing protein 3 n=1 Tax=Hippocampus comes TaxID=109280 RepID=UPI00094EFDA6|nr:PREDICTED: ras guanyl-releasing protein 3 [Hippocampus comes]XP_019737626.1 PREDICTED: ras guanyl-releasing protein 3 [Hippocampus comes]XP_019737627.1 PREDICTED: ras guanyl-releasing protein 3 [Hippocampus comes]XP_019737628.1 PREDICTED: ras guanyl-releasing protein 3 [Hippocampus comes]